MGVLGLAPFIQKYCPDVIRELPHRLRSLSGKTIAIDGTLITQRLHFAPMPCENRHVLGWYRLVRELKESGVGVICVFDGAKRGLAKQRENEKRRKAQRMEVARGVMEAERLRRLRRLTQLLKHYQVLPEDERDRSTQSLRRVVREMRGEVTEEPSLGIVHMSDSDISQLVNERLTSKSIPPSIPREHAPCVDSSTVVQCSTPGMIHAFGEVAVAINVEVQTSKASHVGQDKASKVRSEEFFCLQPSATDEPEISRTLQLSAEEAPASDLVSRSLKRNPLSTAYSNNLPFEVVSSDHHNSHSSNQAVQLPTSIEPYSVVTPSPDYPQDLGASAVSASSTLETTRDYPGEDKDELSIEFSDFFRTPSNVYVDMLGLVSATQPHAIEPPDDLSLFNDERHISPDFDVPHIHASITDPTCQPDNIGQGLLSLYQDYHQSIPAIMFPSLIDSPEPEFSEEVDGGAQEQYAMSKNQVQLTLDEGNLWRSFMYPSTVDEVDIDEILQALAHKSEALSKSYEKRTNSPTTRTYEESKLILRAMGVPCIETTVPYEAEALAAALVRHGFADYVASEDTDVLVYEAPLLRNITNRQSPLTLLSGAEIRQVLQLDRASYVDFALLLGTDFSQRIKNLGPHRAIKLIRAYGRIEHVIANEPKFTPQLPADVYLEQVEIARLIFETLPPLPDPKLLQSTESDEGLVAAILDKYGVHRAAMMDWDFASSLDGNYFGDNPSMK